VDRFNRRKTDIGRTEPGEANFYQPRHKAQDLKRNKDLSGRTRIRGQNRPWSVKMKKRGKAGEISFRAVKEKKVRQGQDNQ